MFVPVFAALAMLSPPSSVEGSTAAPPVVSCVELDGVKAMALARYKGLENRSDDDRAPVDDSGFQAALNAPRAEDARLEQWRAPATIYPTGALAQARVAACAGVFDVATNGKAINIAAACTDPVFEPVVRRSIAATLFLPPKAGGAIVPARMVTQPFSFCLGD